MYESPIRILYSDLAKRISTTLTDNVVKAVQSYNIHVDADELLRALNYDRMQYEKGYADAKEEFEKTWIPCSERLPKKYGWYQVTTSEKEVACRWYSDLHGWETFDDAVIAWLPRPEPYKGGAV